jgi:DNA-binding XRE family transcriptional regulator
MRSGFEPGRSGSGRGIANAAVPARASAGGPTPEKVKSDVGRFFLDLRQTFRLSQAQAAQQLGTRPEVILALETGDVRKLPPWPETCRIVRSYTGGARLDPRPVLHLLELLQALPERAPMRAIAPPVRPAPSAAPAVPQATSAPRPRAAAPPRPATVRGLPAVIEHRSPPPRRLSERVRAQPERTEPEPYDDEERPGLLASVGGALLQVMPGRSLRALLALSVPVAIVVLLTQTSVLEAAVAQLPPSVARIVRGAQNYVIVQLAPIRDGMRWIDVPDPRSRRADKLQTAAQSD